MMKKNMKLFDRFLALSVNSHLFLGFLVRTVLIIFGTIQDEILNVPYTDVDYKVFSDASRYVFLGLSPYTRHTYRYSPLLAYLTIPNHLIHHSFGKFVFSLIDVITTLVIDKILQIDGVGKLKRRYYSLFWLYNPLTVVISSRGNSDSVSAFLVLLTIYLFKRNKIICCGLVHGLSVHLRLYPVIYSIPLYFCLKDSVGAASFKSLLYPTLDRFKLVVSCLLSFTSLFIFFYWLYGDEFVNESLLFHFRRVDVRHNYSVFFYYQYLSFEWGTTPIQKMVMITPVVVLLFCFSLYYNSEKDLSFCMLIMSFTFVSFNRVLTCQYFIWYLCLVPLCLGRIRCPTIQSLLLAGMWLLSQLTWLLPAYLLEFKFKNTFTLIWLQGTIFYICNIMLLSALIQGYSAKVKSL